jgi:hypothetical protein
MINGGIIIEAKLKKIAICQTILKINYYELP